MASSSSKPFIPGIERSITMAPGRCARAAARPSVAVERATDGEPDARRRPGDEVDRIGIVIDHENLAGYRRVVDLQSVKQPLLRQRLGEMLAGARDKPAPPVVVDRREDHRDLVELRVAAQLAEHVPAGAVAELQVEQDEIGTPLLRERYAVRSRVGDDNLVVRLLQPALHQFRGRSVVFDHKGSLPALADTGLCRCRLSRSRPAPAGEPASSRGTVIVNADPSPTTLRTETSPPINRTSLRVIARPSPLPPYLRVVVASACTKVSKSRAELGLAHPDAGVGNLEHDHLAMRPLLDPDRERDRTPFGELHRIAEEVQQALPELGRVAREPPGIFRYIDLERHVRRPRRSKRHHGLADETADVDDAVLELDASRFDLGDIEDVVDQRRRDAAPRG